MPPTGKRRRARADAGARPAGPPFERAPREEPAASETEPGADPAGRGHAEAEAERARAAEEALDQVETDMGAGDVHMARKALRAARTLVGTTEAARADDLERRLAVRERLAGPSAVFAAACDREDWVSARRHARLAAGLAEGGEAAAWRAAAEKCDARVRSAWRLGEVLLDAEPEGCLADCADLLAMSDAVPARLLADDGATLVLVSALERWVFLREIDLERRRVRRLGWLRAPATLEGWIPAQVDDGSIHIVGETGGVLQLSRRPLDVVRWTSLRPFMLPDRLVEAAFVVPPGRFIWGELKQPDEDQAVAVIDTEEWRVLRRPAASWFDPVPGADPTRMLASTVERDEPAALFDERGARLDWDPPPGVSVEALGAHPDGAGWVALVAVLDAGVEREEAPLGLLELRPERPPAKPLLVPGSYGGAGGTLAVSLDERLLFVLTHADGAYRLFAYRCGPDGVERAWDCVVSARTALVQDSRARRVLAVASTQGGLEFAVLRGSPPRLAATPADEIDAGGQWPSVRECNSGKRDLADLRLGDELWRHRRAGDVEHWVERLRRERRRDPEGLAELAGVLTRHGKTEMAEGVLAFGLGRAPDHARLLLARAALESTRGLWDAVERTLEGIDPAALASKDACHLHHLGGLARLRAGDARGALRHFSTGEKIDPGLCGVAGNLALARALLDPLAPEPAAGSPAVLRLVHACRLADACFARGDAAGAVAALDRPLVFARLERQSAARLAEGYLGLDPADPLGLFRKAVALARAAALGRGRPEFEEEIPGLGWGDERIAAVAQKARDWLEGFARREAVSAPTPPPPVDTLSPGAPPPAPPRPAGDSQAPPTHSLPPLGHESIRALVSGLGEAVRAAARYVRALPGWDETQTLGEDSADLAPVRSFLAGYRAAMAEAGVDPEQAAASAERLSRHLDYCIDFELHRRKLFFADASLAWMLAHTSLDIEGRALRLPFPCFGLAFTDRATLERAGALLQQEGLSTGGGPLRVLTVFVKRVPAPEGRRGVSFSMVFDARDGQWPHLLRRGLCFGEDDDLDDILDSRLPDTAAREGAEGSALAAMRPLLHLAINAILYSTSADVAWPLSQSPIRRLQAQGRKVGKARQARIAHRARELRGQYSDEDVFYLPGRIPISQLRRLQQTEREPRGGELMARFMVRGHWRRAARGWRQQRLRWIEPYWKGPELAMIIEREYKLEI